MGASSSARRRREERRAAAGIAPPPSFNPQQQNYAPYPLVAPNLNGVPNFYPHSQGPQAPVAAPASTDHVHKTTTVRNLVNLKKPTLTVKPCADKPHLLRVAFSFDAVSPCSVSLFPMGTEQTRAGALISQGPLGPRVMYPKGIGQAFPPEGLADPDMYCIDTSLYPLEQRQSADDSTGRYPLIIRLETLAAAGATEDLTAFPVGCAQTRALQSQTTFAVLGEEGGVDVAKVVKQKIWVDESSYELQEIYGLTDASSTGDTDMESVTDCVVCLVAQKNTTVLPCRHFCMCNDCAKALLKRSRKCPMCRLNITSVLQIQIAERRPRVEAAPPVAPDMPADLTAAAK